MTEPQPHDLIWIDSLDALVASEALPEWVGKAWTVEKPLVVRRDSRKPGLIAVGIRGTLREQRHALWCQPQAVIRNLTPEALIEQRFWEHYDWAHVGPIAALIELAEIQWPMPWGVGGSCGYALATGDQVMRPTSDLDLLIRTPTRPNPDVFLPILAAIEQLPVRADIQLQTPQGGVALNEWLKQSHVMVKSAQGPYLCNDPWA